MTIWTGVWTDLGIGIDRFGLGCGQNWTWVDTNWVGVWTVLSYPMYSFLHIYKKSIINSGIDAFLASFYCIFGFAIKYFDRQTYGIVSE